jgi:pteridine reductase
MLTRALARDLAPEIRVNAVAPGAILWPESAPVDQDHSAILARIPLGRTGEPADIAGAVGYLILDAPYVTGHILTIDGGRTLEG